MVTKQSFGPALLALIFGTISLPAQTTSAAPHHNPNPVVTRPDSIEDTGIYGYWNGMTEQGRAGGALLGKVVVQDELLPWDPILVTVACDGKAAYTAETDSKGNFAILPSRIAGELSQLGDRERQMKVHFEGCVLEGALAGFNSSIVTITERNLRDTPEVGTITLTRAFATRGTAVSATSKSAPANATQHWTKAGEEMLAGRPDRALRDLKDAVHAYPQFAEAWYRLGTLQLSSNPREAQVCLRKAAAADPAFVPPYEQLAGLAVQQSDWSQALASVARYLELDPAGTMRIWYYSALSDLQVGNVDAAETSANKLLAMDPLHNIRNGEQLLAVILARKADYADALVHLRHCLTYVTEGPDAELLHAQITQLENRVSQRN